MAIDTLDRIQGQLEKYQIRCLRDEPMSRHTTFKIGGPADLLVSAETVGQVKLSLQAAREGDIPCCLLGNGSNMLVSDDGIRGMVISLAGEFRSISREGEKGIRCGAGAALASVCAFARDQGLAGLEFAWGIPGSAGGAAYMNAGAYGGEMKNVLVSCEHITWDGETGIRSGEEMGLSYRHSVYTDTGAIVLFLHFQLEKGDPMQIGSKMDELMNRRKEKQPYDMPSAGSVFKRPEGHFAGTLIEQCGLKGTRIGGAQVSTKHAGFIVNTGGASCSDVLRLIDLIQKTVFHKTGIALECEVRTIGP